jgi:predicted nuclease of restriction endonuclease-like (RecB) superfamily
MPKKQNETTKPTKATKSAVAKNSATEILAGYEDFLQDLKTRIRSTQIKAAIAVNTEMITLYWETGKAILQRQQGQGWGAKIIDRLAHNLLHEFPEMKSFSARNLKYMRAFAEAYPDR